MAAPAKTVQPARIARPIRDPVEVLEWRIDKDRKAKPYAKLSWAFLAFQVLDRDPELRTAFAALKAWPPRHQWR